MCYFLVAVVRRRRQDLVRIFNRVTAAFCFAVTMFAQAQAQNAVPLINTPLVPASTAPGAAFTLTVNGTGFVSSSTVNWNGNPLATTFVNAGQLRAAVPAVNVASAGTAAIVVFNPAPGGGTSNVVQLSVVTPTTSPTFSQTNFSPLPCCGGYPAFAMGDFNGDGKPDLLYGPGGGEPSFFVLIGNGDGTFQPPVNYVARDNPVGFGIGDFNGDGKLDVAVTSTGDDDGVEIFLGNGDGTFQSTFQQPYINVPGAAGGYGIALGDVNRDGKLDFLEGPVGVFLGNGDGTFSGQGPAARTTGVALGDINHDGNLDWVVSNFFGNDVGIMFGNGDGTFQPPVNYSTGAGPQMVKLADLDGDGILDLAVTNSLSNTVSILIGKADGTFKAAVDYAVGGSPFTIATGDLNGDGKQDLAVSNMADGSVSLLLGNGDGTFNPGGTIQLGFSNSETGLLIGDLNGDGRVDLVAPSSDQGSYAILLQNNTETGSNVSVQPAFAASGTNPVSLTFSSVTQSGSTSLTETTSAPTIPSGFQLGQPAVYYNLSTNAGYSGPITICIKYAGVIFNDPASIAIWHYDSSVGSWVQLATTINAATTTACASTPSLSPFALLESAYLANVQQPINADGSSVFSASKGVVPVKFDLTLGNTPTCTLPSATIAISRLSGSSPGTVDESVYTMSSDNGAYYRISSCQYVYNVSSKSLGAGTYRVDIAIGGSTVGSGYFGLK